MDLTPVNYATIFSLGAAGCFSMARCLQLLERRRNRTRLAKEPGEHDDGKDGQPVRDLFPNGEKMQILRAIKDLRRENEERRDENAETAAICRKIAEHLRIEV